MHTDCNEKESILVYPYFKNTLLAIIQGDPEFPVLERKKILRQAGEAIGELHGKDWIHIVTFYAIRKTLSFSTLTKPHRQM